MSSSFALLIEYNGLAFHGSQAQRCGGGSPVTVHDTLLAAFHQIGLKSVRHIVLCSRTDAGVSAKGMVGCVAIAPEELLKKPEGWDWPYALNGVLPDSVMIRAIAPVNPSFHPQRDALYKWYRYVVYTGRKPNPNRAPNTAWIREKINLPAMQQAAPVLLGEHHFGAFQASDPLRSERQRNPQCNVISLNLSQPDPHTPECIAVDIIANRYLYKMVRNIVGELLYIGKQAQQDAGFDPILRMTTVLQSQDRQNAAPTAPASGLTLMAVHYLDDRVCFTYNAEPYPEIQPEIRWLRDQILQVSPSAQNQSATACVGPSVPVMK